MSLIYLYIYISFITLDGEAKHENKIRAQTVGSEKPTAEHCGLTPGARVLTLERSAQRANCDHHDGWQVWPAMVDVFF